NRVPAEECFYEAPYSSFCHGVVASIDENITQMEDLADALAMRNFTLVLITLDQLRCSVITSALIQIWISSSNLSGQNFDAIFYADTDRNLHKLAPVDLS